MLLLENVSNQAKNSNTSCKHISKHLRECLASPNGLWIYMRCHCNIEARRASHHSDNADEYNYQGRSLILPPIAVQLDIFPFVRATVLQFHAREKSGFNVGTAHKQQHCAIVIQTWNCFVLKKMLTHAKIHL